MRLLRCHISGFGKLANMPVSFASGLNVVYAANEGGKSTLQRFLTALLYGQLRPDVKAQRRLEAWVEQYKPWRSSDYGGTLWCALENGRELELHRTFGRDDSRFEVRTAGGEDITREYETQRNGDVLFAASHLGLSKELYESVAVIRESETAELKHRETLRDRIANLAQSGDEKLSVRLSLVKLEEALEVLGSERAPTRPYKQALDRLKELQDERAELDAQRRQCQAWVHEKVELGEEIGQLEQDLLAAGRGVVDARWREARLRVQTLEEIDGEMRLIRSEIETLAANPDFPTHLLDELNRLEADGDSARQRLDELSRQIDDVRIRLGRLDAELRNLASYERLRADVEPEKVTEWFVTYLSQSRHKDELQRNLNHLLDEAATLLRRLDGLSPLLQEGGIDWERKARLAADEERAASEKSAALSEKLAQAKAEHARTAARTRHEWFLSGLSLAGVLAAASAGLIAGILPPAIWLVLATVLGVLGAIFLLAASRSGRAARQAQQSVAALDAALKDLRNHAQAARVELQKVAADSGFESVDEFLVAARKSVVDRQRLDDLAPHIREVEKHRDRLQVEADAVYANLKECLSAVGLSCAPGNVKAPVDTLRANMKRFAETRAARKRLAADIDALEAARTSAAERVGQIDSRIQAILLEGAVDTPASFRQACRDCRRLHDLRAREVSRAREFERLRGALTIDQWRARLEELQGLRGSDGEEAPAGNGSGKLGSYLPYLPSVEEAESEEKRIAAVLAGMREKHAALAERVRQAFHNFRAPAEVEEDLAVAEQRARDLTLNRKALTLALESIQKLARLQQENCAPQLNRAVEDRFLLICPEGYDEVRIDPDFRIQVREKGAPELRPAESLSRGTQDQLYFAVRFGILELLANSQESCPCLLDEPFVAYDQGRIAAAFRILEAETAKRQLILFTCREDVRDLGLKHGSHLVTL